MADLPALPAKTPTAMKKETKVKEKRIKVEFIPSLQPRLGRAYANFVQVSHSPFDFTIRFCEAPSSADIGRISGIKEQEDAKIEIPNIVELIVAPNLLPQLIEALHKNYEKYQKQYGAKGE